MNDRNGSLPGLRSTMLVVDDWIGNDMEHHGIKGQAWGKRHGPPYPLEGDDRKRSREFAKKNREEKKREKEKVKIKKRVAKVQKKQAKQEQKDAKEQQKQEEKLIKEYERRIEEKQKYARDPAQLYKHREMYSPEEIAQCLKTFELEAKVKTFIDANTERKQKRTKNWLDTTRAIINAGSTVADAYNLYVSVNRYLGGDAQPFKLYKKDGGGDNQQKKDNNQQNNNQQNKQNKK